MLVYAVLNYYDIAQVVIRVAHYIYGTLIQHNNMCVQYI